MPIVNIPGAGLVRFPDDMSDKDIGIAIRQDILPTVQKSGFGAGLSGGLESLKGSALATKYAITGSEADRKSVLESQARAEEKFQGVGLDDVTEAFKERGVLAGLGRTWEAAKGTLGQSLPFMAAPVIGAAAAPAILPAAGIAGLSAGAIGFAAPSLAQYTGTNIGRQVEEQEAAMKRGETPQDLSLGKAALAAVPATILDRFALGQTFKGTGLGKLFGQEGKEGVEAIAKKIVENSGMKKTAAGTMEFTTTPSKIGAILTGGARGIAAEIPNEVGQQILERAQAGLDLTSDDAIREYKEAAFGATLLGGPLGGASGLGMRSAGIKEAGRQQAAAQQEEQQRAQLQAETEAQNLALEQPQLPGMEAPLVGPTGVRPEEVQQEAPAFELTPQGMQGELDVTTPQPEAPQEVAAAPIDNNFLKMAGLASAVGLKAKGKYSIVGLDLNDPQQAAKARENLTKVGETTKSGKIATAIEEALKSDPRLQEQPELGGFPSQAELDAGQVEKDQADAEFARKQRNQQYQSLLAEMEAENVAKQEAERVAREQADAAKREQLARGVTEDITQVPFTSQVAPGQIPQIDEQPSAGVPSEVRAEDTTQRPEPSMGADVGPVTEPTPTDTEVGGRALGDVGGVTESGVQAPAAPRGALTQAETNRILAGLRKEGLSREEAQQQVAEATPEELVDLAKLYAPIQTAAKTTAEQEAEIAAAAQTEGEFGDISARQVAGEAPATGVPLEQAKQQVAQILRGWKRDINVQVVNRNNLPEGFQQRLLDQNLLGAKGFVDEKGNIFVIANNNNSAADIEATVFHEALGHLGLRLKFKNELASLMNKFYNTNADMKRAANEWLQVHKGEYDEKLTDAEKQAKAVEEVLADRAEAGRLPASIMDKLKALVNKFARMMGMTRNYSDAEIRSILDQAQKEVTKKAGAAKTEGAASISPRSTAASTMDELYQQAGGYTPTQATTRAATSIKKTLDSFSTVEKVVDKINNVRTRVFSADTKFNARVTKSLKDVGLDWKNLRLTASMSQALHRGGLAERFLEWGTLTYNKIDNRWNSERNDINIVAMGAKIREIADAAGVDPIAMKGYVGEAWVAKRLQNINQEIGSLEKEIDAFTPPKNKTARAYQENRKEKLELLQRVAELRTPEKLAAGLKLYDKIGADNMKALDEMKNTLRKRVLDMMVDTQVMTREKAETFLENAEWVPFYRVTDEDGSVGGPYILSKGLSEQMKEKGLRGATGEDDKKQVSGVDNLVKWLDWSVRRAVSNQQKLVMVDQFKQYVADEIHEGKGDKGSTISVMEEGQEKFYHFDDPLIAEAFTGMLPVMVPGMKGWRAATEGLRKAITRFPLFPVAQIVQDTYDSMFTSGLKHPTKIITGVIQEIFRTYKGTSTARETLMGRGILSRDYSAAAEQEAAEVLAGLRDQNWWQKLNMNLERFSSTADHIVRQAVYNQAKAEGLSEREAVEKATEIINFRRQGSATWVNWMRTMVPFFGAYLQVQNVALKTISGEGISPTERKAALATLAMTAGKVALFSTVYSMMMGDDDDYKELDRRTRDRMILIPGTSVGIAIRPNVFATPKIFAEHAYGYLTDNGTTDGTKIRAAAKAALIDSVLPSSYAVPQLVRPALEVAMDHNIFLDKPIVGNLKNLEKYEQFTSSTSELGRLLGSSPLSPLSPVQWDHLLRGYLSSVGSVTMLATNDALAAAAGRPRPDKSWQDTINAIPNMGNFVTKEFGSGDKTDFYELAGEVEKVNNTVNRLEAQGRGEEIESYLTEEKQQLLSLKKPIASIQKQLAAIRKQKNAVLQSTDMTAAEKTEAMRELNEAEKEVVKGRTKELREAAGF